MKIKRIHTSIALMSKEHKHSFDEKHHTLEFNKEFGMFVIDGETLVPISNVREVLIEKELVEQELKVKLIDSVIEEPKRKKK